ncbi:MAG: hypothetical protein AAF152_21150 [Cyanobacteria bacterium P01_A01_bin.114]
MSPLVEQIVQRLERLPDKVLRQILEIVNLLEPSTSTSGADIDEQHEPDENTSNLKKVGNVWDVKASKQAYTSWDTDILSVREARIEKFIQW